ncbi:hypothetical protein PR048_016436 [Dryococelus australis]|uniref:DUF4371 domain-containing protein n=1 Tax=Dryococelus australis TaxID=614101 RepID=A0ABQ9HJT0_9NEOP|nr:hypothetical protein PR048_016436 [Dryococelus australis]
MAGVLSGIQARIRTLIPKALFVPCTNHSLNLCGVHPFESVLYCVTFFGALDRKWAILVINFGVTVNRLSDTGWSAHYEAVKSVQVNFKNIVDALKNTYVTLQNFQHKSHLN